MAIPPDIQYCIDGAVELDQMTADIAVFMMHLDTGLKDWFDARESEMFKGRPSGYSFAFEAEERYIIARPGLSQIDRAACSLSGLRHSIHQFRDVRRHTAERAIRSLESGRNRITPRNMRRARSPKYIRRFARGFDPLQEFVGRVERVIQRSIIDFDGISIGAANDRCRDLHRRRQEDIRAEFIARGLLPGREAKHKRKQRRKALARSYNFAASLIGKETASAFIRGDRITISGRNMDFTLRNNGVTHGYGGWVVDVVDKNEVMVCELCVYQDDVDTIDQVSALAMHVMAGNEEAVLAVGNLHRAYVTNHPILDLRTDLRGENREIEKACSTDPAFDAILPINSPEIRDLIDHAERFIPDVLPTNQRQLQRMAEKQPGLTLEFI